MYPSGNMRQVTLDNEVKEQDFGYFQYVQAAVKNVEEYLKNQGKKPITSKGHMNSLTSNYRPQINVSQQLDTRDVSYYQSLIDILRCKVELGQVDICVEVSTMSYHVYFPIKGNIDQVLQIFGYLKNHHNAEMFLDTTDPDISM